MTQPAKVQEPSMEEILASIRRIIADDESKAPADKAAAGPAPPATPAVNGSGAAVPPAAKPSADTAATNSQDDIDALMAGFDAPASTSATAAPATDAGPEASEDDVLDLTDEMALPDMPEPTFDAVEPANDLEFNEAVMAGERQYPATTAAQPSGPRRTTGFDASDMLSQSTAAAVESAFNSLANTVLSHNARTLEDLVREMLRPMLKSWLDDNLPGLVERIVKAEIERVSRGR